MGIAVLSSSRLDKQGRGYRLREMLRKTEPLFNPQPTTLNPLHVKEFL